MIDVKLLGPPRVERDGRPVAFDTRKAVALLGYLALSDRPRPRDVLAELLWEDLDVEHARGALRRTLSTLRAAVGGALVEATRDHVRLLVAPDLSIDVHRFRALCAAGDLAAAAAVFQGEFLEGFFVSGAPAFEDWQRIEAEGLRRELAGVLGRLTASREAEGDLASALQLARRWLALDELHEPAHRAVITLLARTGNRGEALSQYRECVRTLGRELGVAPLRETTALYEAVSQGTLDMPAAVPPSPRRESTPTPMVGRGPVLAALLAAYRGVAGHGRAVVIEGEAGIGKTRLAEEFLARLRRDGSIVVLGRAYEEEAALSYAPVIGALQARLLEDPQWPDRLPVHARREAARLLPELTADDEGTVAADAPGASERFLAGLWETLITATAGRSTGVLAIDDAQWADEASLQLLAYGLRRLSGRRLLVLLTWRTPADHSVRRVLPELERAGHATVHALERLRLEDVGELLGSGGRVADPDRQQRLYAETEGLPFLLVEYLQVLDVAADQSWELPIGARDLLRSRLRPVSEVGRQVLSAAAVIGRSFDADTVRTISGRGDEETVAALEELGHHGLVREGRLDYDFAHEKLRTMVYSDTSLARRRLLHRRAAAATGNAATTARHLQLAGEEEAAALAYVRAAGQARAVFANAEAIAHLRAALALGHPDPSALYAGVGELLTLQGDYSGAINSYEMAAATSDAARLSGIEHRLGQVHHRRGEWSLAEAHLDAALSLVDASDLGRQARIRADLSLAVHAAGDATRAADLAADAHELAVAADDVHALAQADNLLGLLASSASRTGDAIRHLTASLALAEQAGDVGAAIAALNNLALAHRDRGELSEALRLTREGLVRCAAQGDRHREAALHNNLADLLHADGDAEGSMQHLKLAVSLFAEIGSVGSHQPAIWKLVQW